MQVTTAKKDPEFNPRTTIGKDMEIVSCEKKNTIFAKGDSPSDQVVAMQCTIPTQQTTRIRERAYALYENRGRISGEDELDWLRAEREILKQSR